VVATLTAPSRSVPPGVATDRLPQGWPMVCLVAVARAYRGFLLTLVAAAMAPMLWSWSSFVVTSGSMEPDVSVGDVVVAAPLPADARIPIGRVMVFTNPSQPHSGVPLVHRVVASKGHRSFSTKGDANAANDTMPVPRSMFRAQARILVPYVGLPFIWLRQGHLVLLTLWLLLTGVVFVVAALPRRWARRRGPPAGPTPEVPESGGGRMSRWVADLRRHRLHTAAIGVALAVVGLTTATASAGFHAITLTGPNRWTATTAMLEPYSTQVLADSPYVYYLLDEASGASAADYSGNSRTGAYAAVTSYHQAGALAHNFGYAVGLAGQGRIIGGGTGLSDPTTFTLELWFKTTTTTGGKLIGFESTTGATSPQADRHLFMRADGRLVYGGWVDSKPATIVSPNAYNNGGWHYVAVTAKPKANGQDAVMYVDGVNVAAAVTSGTAKYTGWWRAGYGSLPTGVGYPPSASFTGQIDNVAVYQTVLTAARVAAHYAAR
jgi:signal peptidase I